MIAACVFPSAVLDHGPAVRLAGLAGPQPGVQGRGDHSAASPGRPARPDWAVCAILAVLARLLPAALRGARLVTPGTQVMRYPAAVGVLAVRVSRRAPAHARRLA